MDEQRASASTNGPEASPEEHWRQKGPYFSSEDLERLLGGERRAARAPTWRGWVLGVLTVAGLCFAVPHIDYQIRHTKLSYSLFPYSPIFILTFLVTALTVLLAWGQTRLGLTRQDLILVYGMGMLVNAIPGAGLLSVWLATVSGHAYYARPENRWLELVSSRFPPSWIPHDPVDPGAPGPRPIAWFYAGLPPGESIPWGAWSGPFLTWSVPFFLLFVLMFTISLLLRRQWSERERLLFPVAQLPEELTAGLDGGAAKPFLYYRAAQWGIALTLALHAWNGLGDYIGNFPAIPMRPSLHPYMTEPPWRYFWPLYTKIFPSVIGFTFLLSLEVSFSLWFFFIVMKAAQFFAIKGGLGGNGWYFFGKGGHRGMFVDQGTGALIAMVLVGLFLARKELGGSIREALGLKPTETHPDDFSPRALWFGLAAAILGMVAWLWHFGLSPLYSAPAVLLLAVVMTGLTRVFCEGGVFYTQLYEFPSYMVSTVATPALMGAQNHFLLSVWGRVMAADAFRVLTMPNIMNAIHLASRTGLRKRSMAGGLVLALLIAVPLGFAGLLYTGYTAPGGAQRTDWAFRSYPRGEYGRLGREMDQLKGWKRKVARAKREGRAIPPSQVPGVARRDWKRIGWIAVGGVAMLLMTLLRARFFWWPHPIGYVVWMGQWSLLNQWFSFFLGWACKWSFLRFGGRRMYLRARRFFIGMIVGEALAAMLWIIVAWISGHTDGYRISID